MSRKEGKIHKKYEATAEDRGQETKPHLKMHSRMTLQNKFYGTNHNYWFDYLTIYPEQGITIDPNYHYIDLVKQAGFNALRQAMVTKDAPTRTPFSALRQACLEKGIFFDFCVVCRDFPAEWGTTGIPMYKQKAMAILNTDDLLNPVPIGSGGWGDLWIDEIAETVRLYQPDAIDVLNEPFDWANVISRFPEFNDLSNDDDFFNKYRNFCERAIVRFRQEKPDVLILINPIPFWDSRRIAANPVTGTNLVYDVHYYYSVGGTYPPDWLPWDQQYWNGNFAEGKQGLYQYWDRQLHGPLADAGLTVWMRECGVHQDNPNWKEWMYDAMEYCRIKGYSFNIHEFVPYPRIGDGLLTSDWVQLSEYGTFCTDYIKQIGGDNVTTITFSGKVLDPEGLPAGQTGDTISITVNLPDGSTEIVTTTTVAGQLFNVSKDYLLGNYSAKASIEADAIFQAAESELVSFTVGLLPRTITLDVVV